jgi:hypothetical protein
MTKSTDDATRQALRAEARDYIAAQLRVATELFKASLVAILACRGKPADEAAV